MSAILIQIRQRGIPLDRAESSINDRKILGSREKFDGNFLLTLPVAPQQASLASRSTMFFPLALSS